MTIRMLSHTSRTERNTAYKHCSETLTVRLSSHEARKRNGLSQYLHGWEYRSDTKTHISTTLRHLRGGNTDQTSPSTTKTVKDSGNGSIWSISALMPSAMCLSGLVRVQGAVGEQRIRNTMRALSGNAIPIGNTAQS